MNPNDTVVSYRAWDVVTHDNTRMRNGIERVIRTLISAGGIDNHRIAMELRDLVTPDTMEGLNEKPHRISRSR